MNRKVALQWTRALRSGKYEQGHCKLVRKYRGTKKYCCLGVLCAISPWRNTYDKLKDADGNYLPQKVADWAGLRTKKGVINPTLSLAFINDYGMKDFRDIADIIENNIGIL